MTVHLAPYNARHDATVNPGSTDCGPGLTRALERAALHGEQLDVYLPAGRYQVNTPISTAARVRLFGDEQTIIELGGGVNLVEATGSPIDLERLRIEGGGYAVRGIGSPGADHVRLHQVRGQGGDGLVFWNIGDDLVDEFKVDECAYENGTAETILALFGRSSSVRIERTRIRNVVAKAIQVGYPDDGGPGKPSDTLLNTWIQGCQIDGVDNPNNTETKGIFSFGSRVHIISNNIKDVTGISTVATEGIYTQGKSISVVDNDLENAGTGEAVVNIKGIPRPAGDILHVVDKPGWSTVVSGNRILTRPGTANTRPLNVVASDIYSGGNIVIGGSGSSRFTTENGNRGGRVKIVGDTYTDVESAVALAVQCNHETITVANLTIDGVRPAAGTCFGLDVRLDGPSDIVKLSDIAIRNVEAADGTKGDAVNISDNGGTPGHDVELMQVTGLAAKGVAKAIDMSGVVSNVGLHATGNAASDSSASAFDFGGITNNGAGDNVVI